MIAKIITGTKFMDAIRVSFEGDNAIYGMYNPDVEVKCTEHIVYDIYSRILNDIREIEIKGVYVSDRVVGYYAYNQDVLISFGLSMNMRSRKYLKALWKLIRSDLKGRFQCYLFTRNIRGCKWLQKNGMKINEQDDYITHLIY